MTTTVFTGGFAVNGSPFGYQRLPGVAGNYASAPDSAALSVTGNIDVRCKVALDDWTPTAGQSLAAKYYTGGNQRSWGLQVATSGALVLSNCANGLNGFSSTSSAVNTVANGTVKWARVTFRASDGRVQFFLSDDGTTWTQLGTDQTNSLRSLYDSTCPLEIGSSSGGTATLAQGKFYRVIIYSDLTETTKVFDADFTTKAVGANTLIESSSNAATVTINGALAQVGDGRVQIISSSAGSAATISQASGTLDLDYLSIKDSAATGGALWLAEPHCINVSGNSGWIFVRGVALADTNVSSGVVRS